MLTPSYVLEPVRALLGGIGLDPCTEPDNPTKAEEFYCLPTDGCKEPWNHGTIFCNPPYGAAKDRWVERCIAESGYGRKVVLLIPSHTETRISQQALQNCETALFVRARLRFGVLRASRNEEGDRCHEAASHGSVLYGFGVDLTPLGELGIVMRPTPLQGQLL